MSNVTDDMNDIVSLGMARDELARRIEELEADNKRLRLEVFHANDTADAAIEQVKELEAKLEKAVEALSLCATDEYPQGWHAISALAELKGQDDE